MSRLGLTPEGAFAWPGTEATTRLTPRGTALAFPTGADVADDATERLADAALVRQLAGEGFAGVRYQIFRGELAAYARPVIRKWIFTGEIYRHSARRGHPLQVREKVRDVLRGDADAREHLAHDAVVAGLAYFHRRALVEGVWEPQGGASLKSFFVGAVILTFKDVYLRFERDLEYLAHEAPAGGSGDIDGWLPEPAWSTGTEDQLAGADAVTAFLQTLDESTRRIVELRMLGASYAEIATVHQMSADSVRARLYRLRRSLRRTMPAEGAL